jgi:membrane-bound serine protease (ClpP class)
VLSAIAHPQIAYLLLTLGTLGLTIEMWNPGAIVPGVAGGICLLLAFFAFQVLPVSYAGVLLIVFGFVLLVLEVKVTSHGILAVGGIASLLFGSLMLIDSPLPELQIGLRLILPIVLALAGIILFLVRLGLQAQHRPAVTGESGMLHASAEALTPIEPGGVGRVSTHGEIWTATALDPIRAGEKVVVTAVNGLQLTVRKAD